MRKNIYCIILSLFLFAVLFPLRVQAASGDGLRLDEGGTVTVVSQHAAKEGISSLCFSLSVESADAVGVEFQFGESKAKILDYRYDQATGSIHIYLAGTEALFAEGADALTVGRIKVLDGNGHEVAATVSAVENSLRYVYGTELITMQGVELPGAVQIGPAAVQPPTGQPDNPSIPQNTPSPDLPSKPHKPPTDNPLTPNNPPASQNPSSPQTPAATQAPAVILPPPPAAQPTAKPVQPPRATESPRPTQIPGDGSPENTLPTESESREPEGNPSDAPALGEDIFPPSPSPDREDTGQTEEDGKEINVFAVVAVIVVLVVVAIEIMAFAVLRKPGKPKRRRRG